MRPQRIYEGEILGDTTGHAFSRADTNGDARINISDAVGCVRAIFLGERRFDCDGVYDANDSGSLNTTDLVVLLSWLFLQGPRLPEPFQVCGFDDDASSCRERIAVRKYELAGNGLLRRAPPRRASFAAPASIRSSISRDALHDRHSDHWSTVRHVDA